MFNNIEKGNIVAVILPKYIDFPGGSWASHFVDKKHYFKAIENPTNNGNFKAIDSKGRLTHINVMNVIELKK